jgi:mannosyltransferase OCH1-like enzyme
MIINRYLFFLILLTIFIIFIIYINYLIKNKENFTDFNKNIPKILHIIWIGDKERPKQIFSWTNDFIEKNKDWKVKIWGNKEIEDLNLINKKQYDQMKQYCGKADIARYEILYRYGGMYIDADTIWLNPINKNILKGSLNLAFEKENLILNTWFSCVKEHPFLKLVIDEIPKRDINDLAWICVGPKLLTDVYNKNKIQDINFVSLSDILCPLYWGGINNNTYNSVLDICKKNKKAFAFHYGMSSNEI